MARRLSPAETVARLHLVRDCVVAGASLQAATRATGLGATSTLITFLRRRVDYQSWPPSPADLDAAIARGGEFVNPDALPSRHRALPGIRQMIGNAARLYGVEPHEVTGKSRKRPIVRARQAVIWAMWMRWPAVSGHRAAMAVGLADHTTVFHNRRVAEVLRRTEPLFRAVSDAVLAAVTGEAPPLVPADVVAELVRRAEESETARRARLVAAALADEAVDEVEAGVALAAQAAVDPNAAEVFRQRRALPRDTSIEAGTQRLLRAIAREHPERVAA